MFYSYDPENGIEFHATAREAQARAENALDAAEFSAADSDWHWQDNEDEISWGEVRGKVELNDREMTPEEKAENPEWSFIRNPKLEPLPNWQPIATAPKDGHAILALLPDSDLPHTIRWRVDGWEITWDQHPLGEFDQPIWWMPIPGMPNTDSATEKI